MRLMRWGLLIKIKYEIKRESKFLDAAHGGTYNSICMSAG